MGAVQKCCGKPTAALGQTELFQERFGKLQDDFNKVDAEESDCRLPELLWHDQEICQGPEATVPVDPAATDWPA